MKAERSRADVEKDGRLSVTADLSLIKHSDHFTIDGFESKTPNFGSQTPSFESGIGDRSCSTDCGQPGASSGP